MIFELLQCKAKSVLETSSSGAAVANLKTSAFFAGVQYFYTVSYLKYRLDPLIVNKEP